MITPKFLQLRVHRTRRYVEIPKNAIKLSHAPFPPPSSTKLHNINHKITNTHKRKSLVPTMDAIYKKPHFYATLDASKKVEAYAFSADKSQFSITPVSENSISHRKNGFSQSPEPRALPECWKKDRKKKIRRKKYPQHRKKGRPEKTPKKHPLEKRPPGKNPEKMHPGKKTPEIIPN